MAVALLSLVAFAVGSIVAASRQLLGVTSHAGLYRLPISGRAFRPHVDRRTVGGSARAGDQRCPTKHRECRRKFTLAFAPERPDHVHRISDSLQKATSVPRSGERQTCRTDRGAL